MIDEQPFDVDILQLVEGGKLVDGEIVDKKNKKYDFNDADVVAEIPLDKIEIIDDIESPACQIVGEIVDSVYKGDQYLYIIRTENEEDFVTYSNYAYNLNDKVGIHINKEDIKIRLKKEVSNYEI